MCRQQAHICACMYSKLLVVGSPGRRQGKGEQPRTAVTLRQRRQRRTAPGLAALPTGSCRSPAGEHAACDAREPLAVEQRDSSACVRSAMWRRGA